MSVIAPQLAAVLDVGFIRAQSDVLFSGQAALTPLLEHAASYTVGALVLLVVCKGIAYAIALSSSCR